ncbi:MAG: T9SS type A sorting domain-containing protein [Bacteroidales bacterium]
MKTHLSILSMLALLFSQVAFSQTIDNLSISPANPGENDQLKVIVSTTFPNSPCDIVDSTISVQNDSLIIDMTYNNGMMPTICNRTDTLTIGSLSPGSYELLFSLFLSNSSSVVDTSTLNFTVQGSSQQNPVIDSLSLIPENPANQDSLFVISSATFPNSDCYMTNSSTTLSNDSVFVGAYHVAGQLPDSCNTIDTIFIEMLSAGSYDLFYYLQDSASTDTFDIDTISFTVQGNNQQYPAIDSLGLIPENPTNQDSLFIISSATFPNSDCYMTNFSTTLSNDSIFVAAYHTAGQLPAFCNTVDTLNIGEFNAGKYELFYHLLDSATTDTFDIDTMSITVQDVSGKKRLSKKQQIEIYPNPANHKIIIDLKKLPTKEYSITLFSGTGQIIQNFKTRDNKVTLNTNSLKNGIYMVMVKDKDGDQQTRKVIITNDQSK